MAKLHPVSWMGLVKGLRRFGYQGPFSGGKHLYMMRGEKVLTLGNPHRREIGVNLLRRILTQAEIDPREWKERV